jgi:catalase
MLSPKDAIDGINERFGRHVGARALHAKGRVCTAKFTATPEAARLTRAAHMQGDPVEARVRVSNGSGEPDSRDWEPDVRGLATKFHLPDGSRTDISAQSVPGFPVKRPEDFVELVKATQPGLVGLRKMPVFVARHPRILSGMRASGRGLKPPASYATCTYYAIHAYKWIDASGGERWVRYRWLPDAGDERIGVRDAKSRGRDYLQKEIEDRLSRGPARFTLELEIAGEGDDPDDPTKNWPEDGERVAAGTLELTGLADGGDELVFDPMRLTDGIEPSGDPILNDRPSAYSESVERRMGGSG